MNDVALKKCSNYTNDASSPVSVRQTLGQMLRDIQRGAAEDEFGWTGYIRPAQEILPGLIMRA